MKSMLGEELNAALFTPRGLLGDRGFALRRLGGRQGGQRKTRANGPDCSISRTLVEPPSAGQGLPAVRITLPDGAAVTSLDRDAATRPSPSRLGRKVTLQSHAARAADARGILA